MNNDNDLKLGYKNKREKTYHCLSLLVFLRLKGSQLEKNIFLDETP